MTTSPEHRPHHVAITPLPALGVGKYRIELDGADISAAVAGAEIALSPGEPPEIRLELAAEVLQRFDAPGARVHVGAEVRDALIALGWTPPPPAPVYRTANRRRGRGDTPVTDGRESPASDTQNR
jgi:hypothetical protein